MLENFDFYDVLKIAITAVLTSGLTYYLSIRKDRKSRIYDNNTKLLDEVYEPIMRIIERNVIPTEGYEGISQQSANEIIEIIKAYSNIADKELIQHGYGLEEELYIFGNNDRQYFAYDDNRKLLDYVDHRRNKLKNRLDRSYDARAFNIRRRRRNKYLNIRSKVRNCNVMVRFRGFLYRMRKKD